jgi:hypothetical protein
VTGITPAHPGASTAEWQRRAVIFLCALAVALSLAWRGNSCGHDFDFHIQSWLDVAQQWRHGTLYPSWIEAANYGAGEPRFIFYPPLSWVLGAILGIVLGWQAAPIAFTLIVLTACGVTMNKLAREWLPAEAATIAACAYILNPYALFVTYERTAYAELAAGIWLPLIILYALRNQSKPCHPDRSEAEGRDLQFPPTSPEELCHPERSAEGAKSKDSHILPSSRQICYPDRSEAEWRELRFQRFRANTIPLTLTIAAIWLTNAPAAVMSCYALAAITIWKSISQKQWQLILNSSAALILGLGLASFYIVPAAYERRWVDITRAIGPGMRIQDSFLFAHTGESFHDQVLRAASLIFVTMTVAIYISVWTAWKRKTAPSLLLPLSVTAAVLFALQLPWSDYIWRFAPELRFLQFPWRWTLALSIVFALSLGSAVATRPTRPAEAKFRLHAAAILIVAIAPVSLGCWLFWQPCDEEDVVSAQVAVFQAGTGFEGTDEYTPIGADNSLIQQGLPKLRLLDAADAEVAVTDTNQDDGNPVYVPSDKDHRPIQVKIEQWLPDQKALTITTKSPGYAVLRLMDYPAWQVFASGTRVLNRPRRDDGLMTIAVPAGTTHIEIKYAATPDVWCGRGLSIASLLTLLTLALVSQIRRQVVLS